MPRLLDTPLKSLQYGQWFKLICGASYQHLPTIRNLVITYGLAGADCIDIAADPAVVAYVQEALAVVGQLQPEAQRRGFAKTTTPWLMVSLNDDDDPHFRKATFDAATCPVDCLRPCQTICPAHAIALFAPEAENVDPPPLGLEGGVLDARCYGCGRCLPVCPQQKISTLSYQSSPTAILPFVQNHQVQAIEIHTQVGHQLAFERLWQTLQPYAAELRVLAISCPAAEHYVEYLQDLLTILSPLPCPLIWQTDGRSMSGDIGKGTTHAAIQAGQTILKAQLPGFVQLAGGTNAYTVPKLEALGLLNPHRSRCDRTSDHLAGIAYGSYARALLQPLFDQLGSETQDVQPLEEHPELLWSAVALARDLIQPLKFPTEGEQSVLPKSEIVENSRI